MVFTPICGGKDAGMDTDEKHEALCKLCAECCRRKIGWEQADGSIVWVMLDIYCPCLDNKTLLCKVYEWRFTNLAYVLMGASKCLRPEQAMTTDVLPEDCSYVPDRKVGSFFRFDPDLLLKLKAEKPQEYLKILQETNHQRLAVNKIVNLKRKAKNK